jgi:hypothetical protein
MVRRRPVMRRSYAQRRVRRVKKYDANVVPLRFKKYLPTMQQIWSDITPVYVNCEEPTMIELQSKHVPESEWPYYLGFMKRMVTIYQTFTDATAQAEAQSLINEYVLRGKNKDVLEQLQQVAAECVGVELLEGDYNYWAKIWDWTVSEDLDDIDTITVTFGKMYVYVAWGDSALNHRFAVLNIADGTELFKSPAGSNYYGGEPHISYAELFLYNTLVPGSYGGASFSVLGKYVLILKDGSQTMEVWKDGTLVWTSPKASVAVPGASTYEHLAIRFDGKYVFALTDTHKLVCFENATKPSYTCPSGEQIVNGGFETGDFTDWTVEGSFATVVPGDPHSGTFSAYMSYFGGAPGYIGIRQDISSPFRTECVKSFTIWVEGRDLAAASFTVEVGYSDGSSSSQVYNLVDDWVYHQFDLMAVLTPGKEISYIRIRTTTAAPWAISVDDVSLVC